jgi:hypothetical protein
VKSTSKFVKTLIGAAVALGTVAAVQAAPIIGTADLTFGNVLVTAGNVDWNNDPLNLNPPPNVAYTYGGFLVQNLTTVRLMGWAALQGLFRI